MAVTASVVVSERLELRHGWKAAGGGAGVLMKCRAQLNAGPRLLPVGLQLLLQLKWIGLTWPASRCLAPSWGLKGGRGVYGRSQGRSRHSLQRLTLPLLLPAFFFFLMRPLKTFKNGSKCKTFEKYSANEGDFAVMVQICLSSENCNLSRVGAWEREHYRSISFGGFMFITRITIAG